jgi:hypothetical protein
VIILDTESDFRRRSALKAVRTNNPWLRSRTGTLARPVAENGQECPFYVRNETARPVSWHTACERGVEIQPLCPAECSPETEKCSGFRIVLLPALETENDATRSQSLFCDRSGNFFFGKDCGFGCGVWS